MRSSHTYYQPQKAVGRAASSWVSYCLCEEWPDGNRNSLEVKGVCKLTQTPPPILLIISAGLQGKKRDFCLNLGFITKGLSLLLLFSTHLPSSSSILSSFSPSLASDYYNSSLFLSLLLLLCLPLSDVFLYASLSPLLNDLHQVSVNWY